MMSGMMFDWRGVARRVETFRNVPRAVQIDAEAVIADAAETTLAFATEPLLGRHDV